jgi:hypothetical protein
MIMLANASVPAPAGATVSSTVEQLITVGAISRPPVRRARPPRRRTSLSRRARTGAGTGAIVRAHAVSPPRAAKLPCAGMRALLGTLVLALLGSAPAAADQPVEGYHDSGDRVGCVMYAHFDANGNAVKCGRRGGEHGLLLTSAGPARRKAWTWPARRLGNLFFTASYGVTYYLYGGTAKLEGDRSILRCRFRRAPVRVRCTNGDGHAIVATRHGVRRIAP